MAERASRQRDAVVARVGVAALDSGSVARRARSSDEEPDLLAGDIAEFFADLG
jgi:hypothetical protein